MAIEPSYQKITCAKDGKTLKERIKVECKTEIESSDVKRIINLSVTSDVTSANVDDDKINYKGKVVYFICYEDVQGDIRKAEQGCEFSGKLEHNLDGEDFKIEGFASVEKTDVNASSLKLTLTTYSQVEFIVKTCNKIDVLTGGEGIISNGEEVELIESLGVRETVYEIEEEFEIGTEVKEVINHKAEAIITSCMAGVGCMIVDGETYLSLLLLGGEENKEIIKEQRVFPFRVEIDSEEVMPSNLCIANVKVTDFKTDISVSGGEGTSLAEAKIKLLFNAEAFENKTQTVIADAFNIEENVKLEKTEGVIESPCECRTETANVSGTANVEEIVDGAKTCASTSETVEILNAEKVGGDLLISSIVSLNVICKDLDGRFFSRKAQLPFEYKMETNCHAKIRKIQAVVKNSRVKMNSNEEIEIQAEITFSVNCFEEKNYSFINGIEACGKKKCETAGICVYIAQENESLWTLAKRLNVSKEDLINSNNDLQFPLTGKERIVVFRQK